MTQDDATYTVTISGPGFRLAVDCDLAQEPQALSKNENIAYLLCRAINMLSAVCQEDKMRMLANIVGISGDIPCGFAEQSTDEIDRGVRLFVDASRDLDTTWYEYDKRQEAIIKAALAATTTDSQREGGV